MFILTRHTVPKLTQWKVYRLNSRNLGSIPSCLDVHPRYIVPKLKKPHKTSSRYFSGQEMGRGMELIVTLIKNWHHSTLDKPTDVISPGNVSQCRCWLFWLAGGDKCTTQAPIAVAQCWWSSNLISLRQYLPRDSLTLFNIIQTSILSS